MSARPFPLTLRPVADTGADKMAEPTDPYFASAMVLPTPGYDGLVPMARIFVEEFALMGWPRDRIERMFRIPRYVAPFAFYRAHGAEAVARIVAEVFGPETGEEVAHG